MLFFPILLTGFMAAVLFFDVTRYIIPNWLVGVLLVLYPAFVLMSPVPVGWPMALAAAGLMFVVGVVIFAFRLMGGGDVSCSQ